MTLQLYCMICVMAWMLFALYFFRQDIFKKKQPSLAKPSDGEADEETEEPQEIDIMGAAQPVAHPRRSDEPREAADDFERRHRLLDDEDEDDPTEGIDRRPSMSRLDRDIEAMAIDYGPEFAAVEALRRSAEAVPPVEWTPIVEDEDAFEDDIKRQIELIKSELEDDIRELEEGEAQTSFPQLEFAFNAAASPHRSLRDDRIAGTTLKDISRTDMFHQIYAANQQRVDEIFDSMDCRVKANGDTYDVVPKLAPEPEPQPDEVPADEAPGEEENDNAYEGDADSEGGAEAELADEEGEGGEEENGEPSDEQEPDAVQDFLS